MCTSSRKGPAVMRTILLLYVLYARIVCVYTERRVSYMANEYDIFKILREHAYAIITRSSNRVRLSNLLRLHWNHDAAPPWRHELCITMTTRTLVHTYNIIVVLNIFVRTFAQYIGATNSRELGEVKPPTPLEFIVLYSSREKCVFFNANICIQDCCSQMFQMLQRFLNHLWRV